MLLPRPTESAVVFLQQLGRGLCLSPDTGKSCLTVLEFIGQQHHRFRFDLRYRALLGGSRRQLQKQMQQGFPFLPPGCRLVLDRVASERVLTGLRQCLPTRRAQLLEELRSLAASGEISPASGLAHWLEALAMDPAEFYAIGGVSFTALRRELRWLPEPPHPEEERLTRAIANGLLHQDDPERLHWLADQLQRPIAPDPAGFDPATERRWRMLMAQLWGSGRQHLPLAEALVRLWAAADLRAELVELFALLHERTDHLVTPLDWDRADPPPIPLKLHGRYSRAEVFAAFGLLNEARPFPGREGVFFDEATQCDVFFITLKKSERLFSPTTRYNDVAISPWEFHWESQSLTREASATGQRYIHHVECGSRVMLFVREENRRGGVTLPFLCLGFAHYVSHHEGERPMAIRWRLQRAIPAAFVPELALAV